MAHKETAVAPSGSPVRPGIVARRELFERLSGASRVVQVSAPAGSGKTLLLRSWIAEAGLADRVAWISVEPGERDPRRFWLSVLDGLRGTAAGSALVRELTAAPGLDPGEIVERLLEDLGSLEDRVWLVIDDVHEFRSEDALRQLELLLMRAPAELRVALVTRHDLRLGLHRLLLEGGLTEIRADELRFTPEQARELLDAAGVELSDPALAALHARTEGWAAGLRLAALSLVGHPDPARFAAEFSGSERMVAEYLLAEVLERQPENVRRLLLRTSILERVSGPLADVLTGACDGQRILQESEQANAFVVSLDPGRSWFRYHHLFADLLQLELRRTAPGELPLLHRTAAEWFAEHRHPVEAIRHAQAAKEWDLATRVLADHWISFLLDGRQVTSQQLLAGFPARVVERDPELLAMTAGAELTRGSLDEAARYAGLAARDAPSLPVERRERFDVRFAVLKLGIVRRRGDLAAAVEEAQRLLAPAEAPDGSHSAVDDELRAIGLIELAIAELWAARLEDVDRHLEEGIALAQRLDRPYLEIYGMAHWALVAAMSSYPLAVERGRQAVELAQRHGWTREPIVAIAYLALGTVSLWQGRLEEAESWLEQTERALRTDIAPANELTLLQNRGLLQLARGREKAALDAFQIAERHARLLVKPHPLVTRVHAHRLRTLVRAGQLERVEKAMDEMDDRERDTGEMRTILATLRLAQGEAELATSAIAAVLDGSAPFSLGLTHHVWFVQAFLLEAMARDALGDAGAAHRALERALEIAEPDGVRMPFLLHPAPALLERHRRSRTSHAALVSEVLSLLAGGASASAAGEPEPPREALSASEIRVLRYLPTNLSLREIGSELFVSLATVKTHTQHLYGKLGVHSRTEAVERARGLGLLAPSSRSG